MASKYDKFWEERIKTFRQLIAQATREGVSDALNISEIKDLGKRENWHGFAVMKGGAILEKSKAHVSSLSEMVKKHGLLNSNENHFRLAVNDQLELTVYKMNWKAHRIAGALSFAEVAALEEILPSACQYLETSRFKSFSVHELGEWIEKTYPHIMTFSKDRGKKELKKKYPECNILNIMNACYHLSGAESFWVESVRSNKRVDPFEKVHNVKYRLKKDWREHLPDTLDDAASADTKPIPRIDRVKVPPPPRTGRSKGNGEGSRHNVGFGPADYTRQMKENQELGLAGEEYVLELEREKLQKHAKSELADKIVHISKVEGDAAGYDVKSYDKDGDIIFIEVKTTAKGIDEPFFVTANELKFSKQHAAKYRLYRVFEFNLATGEGKLYEESGSLDERFSLSPRLYMARM